MALRTSPLEQMRPEFTADVLAQKARDAIRQLGYTDRPATRPMDSNGTAQLIEHSARRTSRGRPWDDVADAAAVAAGLLVSPKPVADDRRAAFITTC